MTEECTYASGEVVNSHDAGLAWLLRKVVRLPTSCHNIFQASVAETRVLARGDGRTAHRHAEALSYVSIMAQ